MITEVGGHYKLVHEIGSGGMGCVYQAVDTRTGKAAAAKVMRPGSQDVLQGLLRFYQEGAVLSTLKHPNIVEVYGTFLEGDSCAIVMELLEGRSLADILRSESLSLARIKYISRQVAAALAYAHSRGITHRDVKPGNIMVVGDDHVKVTDFGIARVLGVWTLTTTGTSMGTPVYMAPEQFQGQKVDGRADIYSLGVVMYQMVTGQPPFQGDDPMSVAFQHVHKPPEPPSQIDARVPPDWEALILKALAKDPANRFQTTSTMEDAISNLSTTEGHVEALFTERALRDDPRSMATESARKHLDQGRRREQAGDSAGALEEYQAELDLQPTGPVHDQLVAAISQLKMKTEQHAVETERRGTEIDRPPRPRVPWAAIAAGSGLLLIAVVAAALTVGRSLFTATPGPTPVPVKATSRPAIAAKPVGTTKKVVATAPEVPDAVLIAVRLSDDRRSASLSCACDAGLAAVDTGPDLTGVEAEVQHFKNEGAAWTITVQRWHVDSASTLSSTSARVVVTKTESREKDQNGRAVFRCTGPIQVEYHLLWLGGTWKVDSKRTIMDRCHKS